MATANDLADALLARLRTVPGVTVYDTIVPDTPAGDYVKFTDNAPRHWSNNLGGEANRLGYQFTVMVVSISPDGLRSSTRFVANALLNWRATTGRDTSWVAEVETGPMIPDESVPGDTRLSQTLRYRITTSRS